jgi:hypothetical protein
VVSQHSMTWTPLRHWYNADGPRRSARGQPKTKKVPRGARSRATLRGGQVGDEPLGADTVKPHVNEGYRNARAAATGAVGANQEKLPRHRGRGLPKN